MMKTENNSVAEEPKQHSINNSKRAFAKKAGLATPILFSFASRPAWATLDNCSFNMALSGNISPGASLECGRDAPSARSPGKLKTHSGEYPSMDVTLSFNTVFNTGGLSPVVKLVKKNNGDVIAENPTLEQVLKPNGQQKLVYTPDLSSPSNSQGMHYAAAYLLAASSEFVYPFTVAEIVADWANGQTLFPTLQAIQDNDMEVGDVDDYLNP